MILKKICSELNELLWQTIKNLKIKLIILECTNLSPYKTIFRDIFSGEIIDLLVLIEKKSLVLLKKNIYKIMCNCLLYNQDDRFY